jgi:S1-C subfamily serine protease
MAWVSRRTIAAVLTAWGCGLAAAAPSATGLPEPGTPQFQARTEAIARASAAVVGLRTVAIEDAASNEALGALRAGSGVVIDADGLVLTIGYLILEAERVDLLVEGERRVPARVVAYDQATGFGLVQALTPVKVTPVSLGRSAGLSGDQPVIVASATGGGELSVARLVSQRSFSGYWEYHIDGALFTAPQREDHSGAALLNLDGELVGIGSLAVANATGSPRGQLPGNMFVPVDLLKPILGELRSRGSSRDSTRAWLGISCVEDPGERGVQVVRVARDGPAEQAGLQAGDRIVRIDDAEIGGLEALYKRLWRDAPERDVRLEIRRDGQTHTLTAHAVDRMKTLRRPQGI